MKKHKIFLLLLCTIFTTSLVASDGKGGKPSAKGPRVDTASLGAGGTNANAPRPSGPAWSTRPPVNVVPMASLLTTAADAATFVPPAVLATATHAPVQEHLDSAEPKHSPITAVDAAHNGDCLPPSPSRPASTSPKASHRLDAACDGPETTVLVHATENHDGTAATGASFWQVDVPSALLTVDTNTPPAKISHKEKMTSGSDCDGDGSAMAGPDRRKSSGADYDTCAVDNDSDEGSRASSRRAVIAAGAMFMDRAGNGAGGDGAELSDSERPTEHRGKFPSITEVSGKWEPGRIDFTNYFATTLQKMRTGKPVDARDIEKSAVQMHNGRYSWEEICEFISLAKAYRITPDFWGNMFEKAHLIEMEAAAEITDCLDRLVPKLQNSATAKKEAVDAYGILNGSGRVSPLAERGIGRKFKTKTESHKQAVARAHELTKRQTEFARKELDKY